MQSTPPFDADQTAFGAVEQLREAVRSFGLARLRIGAILASMKDSDAWQAAAGSQSFNKFLEAENIEPKAAYQYMEAARCFVFDLDLSPAQLSSIAHASMRTLLAAKSVITHENLEQVLAIIVTQPRQEAISSLQDLTPHEADHAEMKSSRSRKVGRLLYQIQELSMDQKIELQTNLRTVL